MRGGVDVVFEVGQMNEIVIVGDRRGTRRRCNVMRGLGQECFVAVKVLLPVDRAPKPHVMWCLLEVFGEFSWYMVDGDMRGVDELSNRYSDLGARS